jgi:hypothetical protein
LAEVERQYPWGLLLEPGRTGLRIGHLRLKTTDQLPMTNFQFSIVFNGAFQDANSILFELRLIVRSCFERRLNTRFRG